MPTTNDILQVIAEHLALSVEDLDRDARLKEDLELDPIQLNDLFNYLSERFEVTFAPDEVEDLQTVDDLVILIEDNLIE